MFRWDGSIDGPSCDSWITGNYGNDRDRPWDCPECDARIDADLDTCPECGYDPDNPNPQDEEAS